jgi:hypothetical protein
MIGSGSSVQLESTRTRARTTDDSSHRRTRGAPRPPIPRRRCCAFGSRRMVTRSPRLRFPSNASSQARGPPRGGRPWAMSNHCRTTAPRVGRWTATTRPGSGSRQSLAPRRSARTTSRSSTRRETTPKATPTSLLARGPLSACLIRLAVGRVVVRTTRTHDVCDGRAPTPPPIHRFSHTPTTVVAKSSRPVLPRDAAGSSAYLEILRGHAAQLRDVLARRQRKGST